TKSKSLAQSAKHVLSGVEVARFVISTKGEILVSTERRNLQIRRILPGASIDPSQAFVLKDPLRWDGVAMRFGRPIGQTPS
ncbi:MAG TPA: hypothetical protein VFU31_10245, partial [Candidatus Binatia bacterium]|nr:hypothetical protein [Candidatus Binatia bacterium]